MKVDIRSAAAKFHDSNPDIPDDIPFYQPLVPSPFATILALGCGTGRVTLPPVPFCQYIQGIARSPAMLSICRQMMSDAGIPEGRPRLKLAILPISISGEPLIEGLRRHWVTDEEKIDCEAPVEGGKLGCLERRPRLDREKLILYPELIYRRCEGKNLVEEADRKLEMRCYYPDDFEQLIVDQDFVIINQWGGYAGEKKNEGPELVFQFTHIPPTERAQTNPNQNP